MTLPSLGSKNIEKSSSLDALLSDFSFNFLSASLDTSTLDTPMLEALVLWLLTGSVGVDSPAMTIIGVAHNSEASNTQFNVNEWVNDKSARFANPL